MRPMLTIAVLTAAVTAAVQPAAASLVRPSLSPAPATARVDRDICRTDLGSTACATYQRRLLNAVLQDSRSGNTPASRQQVADRQLAVLIASVD